MLSLSLVFLFLFGERVVERLEVWRREKVEVVTFMRQPMALFFLWNIHLCPPWCLRLSMSFVTMVLMYSINENPF